MDAAADNQDGLDVGAAHIAPAELGFTFQQSGGPGGQNVNKVATRVTLTFDLVNSPSLTPSQKERIASKLFTRINNEGVLRVVASRHRTQAANRRAATERFVELLTEALYVPKRRKKSSVPAGVKRKRLEDKVRRGATKQQRRQSFGPDE